MLNFEKREEKIKRAKERELERERIRKEKEAARRAEINENIWWIMTVKYKSPKYPNGKIREMYYEHIELEREAVKIYNNWTNWAKSRNTFCEIEAYMVNDGMAKKWEPQVENQ